MKHSLGKLLLMFVQTGTSYKWANDGQHLLLENFDKICDSPSQIYCSALPLSPSSSWLRECYSTELLQNVKVVKGLPAEWGVCSHTVAFGNKTSGLACWRDTIMVGLEFNIIILDGITGIQEAVLYGHTKNVICLSLSPDGASLASGGYDDTIKLWDVQTGGIIKTLYGHSSAVCSVSISPDCTTIVSGSHDNTVRLWDIQTMECCRVMEQEENVDSVSFSPTNPQHFIFTFGGKAQQCNTNGHKINPLHDGSGVSFSSDGVQYMSYQRTEFQIRNSDSGVILTKIPAPCYKNIPSCFSPDSRLIAVGNDHNIYIWDITGSDPHLVQTFIGHTNDISFIQFSSPSSIVSTSWDQSVKCWQIGATSTTPTTTDLNSIPSTSALIRSITLHAKDDITITSDSDGVVKTWDISTGHCKASFQTPAKGHCRRDVRLIDDKLKLVWWAGQMCHIWDVEGGELLQKLNAPGHSIEDEGYGALIIPPDGFIEDIKISGDGSKVFLLSSEHILVSYIQTEKATHKLEHVLEFGESLIVDGSKLWVNSPFEEPQGWDFGTPTSPCVVELSGIPLLYLNETKLWDTGLSGIKDTATGKVVFQLCGKFAKPVDTQLDSGYLVARFKSGEMLILDFNHVHLQ